VSKERGPSQDGWRVIECHVAHSLVVFRRQMAILLS
jgi:hypothetical protein